MLLRACSPRHSTYADSSRRNRYKATDQILFFLLDELNQIQGNSPAFRNRIPQENDTDGLMPMRINQASEILVFGQKNPVFDNSQIHHPLIICPRLCLPHLLHIIPGLSQGMAQQDITALIYEKTHDGFSQEAFLEMKTVSSWAIVSAAKRIAACISSETSCGYA